MQHRSNGFTLIELLIVIVILGIIAAIAAPKFLNLSTDARIATLNSLEGAIRSASNMVNYKAVVENKLTVQPTLRLKCKVIPLLFAVAILALTLMVSVMLLKLEMPFLG
jgi:MSHA pilin protein MshA